MDQSGYNNNYYFGSNWNQYNAERRFTENQTGTCYEAKDMPSCSYEQASSNLMSLQNSFLPSFSENVWSGHTQNLESMYYNGMTVPASGSHFDSMTFPISGTNFDIHPSKDVVSSQEGFPSPHSTSEELESSQRRTTFTKVQLQKLEERFLVQSFLSKEERVEFSFEIGLTERQVMIWFQNRRLLKFDDIETLSS